MNTIKIAKEVFDKTPNVFKNLPEDGHYRLVKTEAKSPDKTRVREGRAVSGNLEIVNVEGEPCVRVSRVFDYIRTSPIVKVLYTSDTLISFETEGGVYQLENLSA